MTKAIYKSPMTYLILVSCLILIWPPKSANAQSAEDQLDRLLQCDTIEKKKVRRACIEEVIEDLKAQRAQSPSISKTARNMAIAGKITEKAPTTQTAQKEEADPIDSIGFPEKKDKKKQKGFRARLVKFQKDKNGRYYFLLDNGQLWREKRSARLSFVSRKTEFIEIKPGAISGWRITFDTSKEMGIVERVK